MTDEQIIEEMAKAMADALRDPTFHHYVKPARAAYWVAKDHLQPSAETQQHNPDQK
jgi:hypothetical protein